jgi:hypothetical protein
LPQFPSERLPPVLFYIPDIVVGGHRFKPLHHPM